MNSNSNETGVVTLLDQIPQYSQIIYDLSRGNLKGANDLKLRKSRLCHSLNDLLSFFDGRAIDSNVNNNKLDDELSYFILFMDNNSLTSFLKLLLDLNNFKNAFITKKLELKQNCARCNSDRSVKAALAVGGGSKKFHEFDEDFQLNSIINENEIDCICSIEYNKILAVDALAIFKKYVSKDAAYSINASDELIASTVSNICPEDGKGITLNCFDGVKRFVHENINKNHFEKYLSSEYRCKYLLYVLKNRSLELVDVLYDDYAIVYFLEFLEQERVSDLLKFWIQAENFSQNVNNIKKSLDEDIKKKKNKVNYENLFKQIQSDAIIIYDNYISLQAISPIGFDKHVRLQIELNICQNIDNNNCEPNYLFNIYSDCFYLPLLIVYNILDKIYFKRFLSCKLYSKYVNELLSNSKFSTIEQENRGNTVAEMVKLQDKEPFLVKDVNKKSYNIEFDSSSINGKTQAKASVNTNAVTNENCSVNEVIQSNKIQIGRIDSLGRYIRQIEDDPELINQSEKKKPFNKLINFLNMSSSGQKNRKFMFSSSTDTNDDEEEMALKAAEMLINDVVNGNKINP